jgi:two-component sensor histidine kinase
MKWFFSIIVASHLCTNVFAQNDSIEFFESYFRSYSKESFNILNNTLQHGSNDYLAYTDTILRFVSTRKYTLDRITAYAPYYEQDSLFRSVINDIDKIDPSRKAYFSVKGNSIKRQIQNLALGARANALYHLFQHFLASRDTAIFLNISRIFMQVQKEQSYKVLDNNTAEVLKIAGDILHLRNLIPESLQTYFESLKSYDFLKNYTKCGELAERIAEIYIRRDGQGYQSKAFEYFYKAASYYYRTEQFWQYSMARLKAATTNVWSVHFRDGWEVGKMRFPNNKHISLNIIDSVFEKKENESRRFILSTAYYAHIWAKKNSKNILGHDFLLNNLLANYFWKRGECQVAGAYANMALLQSSTSSTMYHDVIGTLRFLSWLSLCEKNNQFGLKYFSTAIQLANERKDSSTILFLHLDKAQYLMQKGLYKEARKLISYSEKLTTLFDFEIDPQEEHTLQALHTLYQWLALKYPSDLEIKDNALYYSKKLVSTQWYRADELHYLNNIESKMSALIYNTRIAEGEKIISKKDRNIHNISFIGGALFIIAVWIAYLYWDKNRQKKTIELLKKDIIHRSGETFTLLKRVAYDVDRDSRETAIVLESFSKRIKAMIEVYTILNEKTFPDAIALQQKIERLSLNILQSYAKIDSVRAFISAPVTMEYGKARLILFIMFELMTNSLKYAFKPSNEGLIEIVVTKENKTYRLIYRDNGRGFDLNKLSTHKQSHGLPNIEGFCKELKGTYSFITNDKFVFELKFSA